MKLIFLGTGGGRHVMHAQVRKTGGLFFDLDDVKFIIDPGPGSFIHAMALGLNPEKWNGILLSHLHIDHSADVNVMLDCMQEPFLIAEQHCIIPKNKLKEKKMDYYPCVSVYHQGLVKNLYPAKHGDSFKVRGLDISTFRAKHYDPTIGFSIRSHKINIAYPGDGPYYRGQEKHYEGCGILILNVLVPKGAKQDIKKHMSVDDAIKFISSMKNKPKLVVLQHFSFWILRANIWKQAKIIQDATKVRVIHAEDFMELDLETLATRHYKKAEQK